MLQKIDKFWIGLVLGLIVPTITLLVFYFVAYSKNSNITYYEMIMVKSLFSKVLSLAVIPSAGVFFLFVWANRLNAAKGVLTATFIIALFVFGIKIFG
ncbi:MAG: hypothetical protein EHM93_00385 [Bacteroidales bacterium]|nr:MAG: hypothetical protein EHM93_00385 [Bacteroidales bacterium]